MLNQRVIDLIKVSEGLRQTAYRDIGGVWTIGYGHTGPDVTPGLQLTQEDCEHLLSEDLDNFEAFVRTYYPGANEQQVGALTSFAYNLGCRTLSNSTLGKLCKLGKYEEAAEEITKWDHVGGREVAGLLKRRQREKQLFLTGDWQ